MGELRPLTDVEKSMVETSWMKVEALGTETVGLLLFKKIFELAPEALQLFSFKDEPGVLTSQKLKKHGVKVVNFLGAAIGGLRDNDRLVPLVQDMGLRHLDFNICPKKNARHREYYQVVGQALIITLQ